MSDPNLYLDAFPSWLKTLGSDVNEFAPLLHAKGLSEEQRRLIVGSINYLFKSLDLIPDGVEDLGYIDDAFVLRVAADLITREGEHLGGILRRLSSEAKLILSFLEGDYTRLESYVRTLTKGAARGRTVDEIIGDAAVRDSFLGDVTSWVASYQVPTFHRDEKTLVKLRSFLDTKLPRL
ncbi:MAG: YkvA family protein [Myxococcales bacterium]|nr:YkvA family protein [Polyangiaceae bacterium]MDW8248740.1 YkvA family protein [Myxococcales bacterium]